MGIDCQQTQFSLSNIQIQNGQDTMQSGWRVNPTIFGDSQTRLYISWTDRSQGNWWLIFEIPENEISVVYWPKSLFTDLAESGAIFTWGDKGILGDSRKQPKPCKALVTTTEFTA